MDELHLLSFLLTHHSISSLPAWPRRWDQHPRAKARSRSSSRSRAAGGRWSSPREVVAEAVLIERGCSLPQLTGECKWLLFCPLWNWWVRRRFGVEGGARENWLARRGGEVVGAWMHLSTGDLIAGAPIIGRLRWTSLTRTPSADRLHQPLPRQYLETRMEEKNCMVHRTAW